MMYDFKKTIFVTSVIFCIGMLSAQDYSAIIPECDSCTTIKAVAVQSDGRIVGAGFTQKEQRNYFAVMRFDASGSLDRSFGNQGMVLTQFGFQEKVSGAQAVMIQADGKIIAGGFTDAVKNKFRACLARYHSDGRIDESFSGGCSMLPGTVIYASNELASEINDLVATTDGTIIAAQTVVTNVGSHMAVAQYDKNGPLLPNKVTRITFGDTKKPQDQAQAIALDCEGRIIIAGSTNASGVQTFAAARLQTDGALDCSFFGRGLATVPGTAIPYGAYGQTVGQIRAVLIQPDGKIIVGGYTNSTSIDESATHFTLVRHSADGALDESFGAQGIVISPLDAQEIKGTINALVLQPDGKIVAGGSYVVNNQKYAALVRYDANGMLDTTFNTDAKTRNLLRFEQSAMSNELFALALQANGNIVAAGKLSDNSNRPMRATSFCNGSCLQSPLIESPCNNSTLFDESGVRIFGKLKSPGMVHIWLDESVVATVATKGKFHEWSYPLPVLKNGNHSIKVEHYYAGGKVTLGCPECSTLCIDKTPVCVDCEQKTCQKNPVRGNLQAKGASGNYIFSVDEIQNGSVVLNGNEYEFTPSIVPGVGSFAFIAQDRVTGERATGKITINIFEKPLTNNVTLACIQDNKVEGKLQKFNERMRNAAEYTIVRQPFNGTLQLEPSGKFIYTPHANFYGRDSFEYRLVDTNGFVSNPSTIFLEVEQAPVANSSQYMLYEDSCKLVHNLRDLISGGTPPYKFYKVRALANRGLDLYREGTFSLKPLQPYKPDRSFWYRVKDAQGTLSNVALVEILINKVPIVKNKKYSIKENSMLRENLYTTASKGVAPYTFALAKKSQNGVVTLKKDGSFIYNPTIDFVGIDSFEYKIIDANKKSSKNAQVTINVKQIFKAYDTDFTMYQDDVLTVNLSDKVTGGMAPYSFRAVNGAKDGEVATAPDGSIIFKPNVDFAGVTYFEYEAIDAKGNSSNTAFATIRVLPAIHLQDSVFRTQVGIPVSGLLLDLVAGGVPPYTFIALDSSNNNPLQLNPDGSFFYIPQSLETQSFLYKVIDSNNHESKKARVIMVNSNKKIIHHSARSN